MKRTQNLFVLESETDGLVPQVFKEVQFKGAVTFDADTTVTESDIQEVYSQNKSLISSSISEQLANKFNAISIHVTNGKASVFKEDSATTYIDVNNDIVKQFEDIANRNNCDIGDHVSNSSGLKGAPTIADCSYCRFIADNSVEVPKMIYKNKNFFVITTLGQFVLPYLLIIPFEHVMSIAELDDARKQEFLEVLSDVKYILNLAFHPKAIATWENGTGNSGKGKAKDSVVHAHVHVASSHYSAEEIEKVSKFNMTKIPFDRLSDYGQHSYLLVQDNEDDSWRINDDSKLYIPRQYVRQLIADEHGIEGEQWNWRIFPFHEKRLQAAKAIHDALKANWDALPSRVKNNVEVLMSSF